MHPEFPPWFDLPPDWPILHTTAHQSAECTMMYLESLCRNDTTRFFVFDVPGRPGYQQTLAICDMYWSAMETDTHTQRRLDVEYALRMRAKEVLEWIKK